MRKSRRNQSAKFKAQVAPECECRFFVFEAVLEIPTTMTGHRKCEHTARVKVAGACFMRRTLSYEGSRPPP